MSLLCAFPALSVYFCMSGDIFIQDEDQTMHGWFIGYLQVFGSLPIVYL